MGNNNWNHWNHNNWNNWYHHYRNHNNWNNYNRYNWHHYHWYYNNWYYWNHYNRDNNYGDHWNNNNWYNSNNYICNDDYCSIFNKKKESHQRYFTRKENSLLDNSLHIETREMLTSDFNDKRQFLEEELKTKKTQDKTKYLVVDNYVAHKCPIFLVIIIVAMLLFMS